MRVTRDESPKNEKYFIREKGEAFDQFNARSVTRSVRRRRPSARPSIQSSPAQILLMKHVYTQQMLLFIIIIVIMQYNDGRFKNKPPATIFIYQHTTLGVIPTPHRSSVYLLYKAGRTDLPAPTPDAQNGYNST
jgi:hypothetical protein